LSPLAEQAGRLSTWALISSVALLPPSPDRRGRTQAVRTPSFGVENSSDPARARQRSRSITRCTPKGSPRSSPSPGPGPWLRASQPSPTG